MTKETDAKSKALREQGCLHSRPEKVIDELFQQSDFFDPRDLIQVKYEMLRRVRVEREPISWPLILIRSARSSYERPPRAMSSTTTTPP